MYYCYILQNTDEKYKNYTYCGYTTNPKRRLRQHNGEIKGGAKATHNKGIWKFLFLISGFVSSNNALSCEWRLKHPDNKKRKNKIYNNISGRILSINEVLNLNKWTENCEKVNDNCQYKYYIDEQYKNTIKLQENFFYVENIDELLCH
jgi:structure-specific endonuclease subunit SLX1